MIKDLYQLIEKLHQEDILPDRRAVGVLDKNPTIFIMKILNSTVSGHMERFRRKLIDKYPGIHLS